MLTILDLFSGIGGFSLGLERAGGFRTVAFCEQNAYATAVLNRHWPGVPVFSDVRGVGADTLRAAGLPAINVVCGGFPCQDISLAGHGAGLDGARSGLWFEMLRIITETRPRFVIAENVAALRSRGLGEVLRGLASVGYDAEWHCIPASALGAPHRRDRVWIIAYPNGRDGRRFEPERGSLRGDTDVAGHGEGRAMAYAYRQHGGASDSALGARAAMAQTGPSRAPPSGGGGAPGAHGDDPHPNGAGLEVGHGLSRNEGPKLPAVVRSDWWAVEPDVGRVADGIPSRVDRLRCLGNAVVPQIPELIGRAILSHVQSVSEMETNPCR